jgi:quercetin dioxygenase-like cupin family protein
MSRKSRFGRLLGLLYVGAVLAISGLWILHAQQKQNSNFTGGTVTTVEENPQARLSHYHFDPGARTKWHSHEKGQIVLVEDGVGRSQMKGSPVVELHAGEASYTPPGVVHWHGASPTQGGTQFNVSRGAVNWLDEVTEKEYTAPPKKR